MARKHDIAKSIILKESGSHFDPDTVEAFIQTEAKFLAIRSKFSESQLIAA
jgi:putative two-component system response regulator